MAQITEMTKPDYLAATARVKLTDKMVMLPPLFDGTKPEVAKQHYERFNQYIKFQMKSGTHTKANIKMMVIKAIITRVIKDSIIIHIEISLKVIVMINQEAEAMAVAETITAVVVTVGPIIEAMLITNIISIMLMMMSARQINTVHHALYVVAIITLPNIVLKESMISMILWKR